MRVHVHPAGRDNATRRIDGALSRRVRVLSHGVQIDEGLEEQIEVPVRKAQGPRRARGGRREARGAMGGRGEKAAYFMGVRV